MRPGETKKKGLLILCFLFILGIGLCVTRDAGKTLAATQVDLFLEYKGGQTCEAPLLLDKDSSGEQIFWVPGMEQSRILALKNGYSQPITLYHLGLTVKLEKLQEGVYEEITDPALYELYAENMLFRINNLQENTEETICNQSFSDLLYEPNNPSRQGFTIPASKKLVLGMGDTIYLEYRVKMAEEADNRLQGLKAMIDFIISVKGQDQKNGDDSSSAEISDHWAHNCILTLVWKGVIPKYSLEIIRADDPLTRGEAAELLVRALGLQLSTNVRSPYIDPQPIEQKKYIITASENNIFRGYPGRFFLPYKQITREEMMCVLIRAFNKKILGPCWLHFIDKDQISEWALNDVMVGVQHKVIVGYPDGSFRPQANITRAEAFTIVCRLLGLHIDHN